MSKYLFPKRVYVGGESKILSMRIPGDLKAMLEKLAKENNRTRTDFCLTILDQFIQQYEKKKNKP